MNGKIFEINDAPTDRLRRGKFDELTIFANDDSNSPHRQSPHRGHVFFPSPKKNDNKYLSDIQIRTIIKPIRGLEMWRRPIHFSVAHVSDLHTREHIVDEELKYFRRWVLGTKPPQIPVHSPGIDLLVAGIKARLAAMNYYRNVMSACGWFARIHFMNY